MMAQTEDVEALFVPGLSQHSQEKPKIKEHFLHSRHYHVRHATRPIRGLNPTRRHIAINLKALSTDGGQSSPEQRKSYWPVHVWRSRDNRKGRHAVIVDADYDQDVKTTNPMPTNTLRHSLLGLRKMLVRYPIWDVSYDVAVVFTIGSVVWVLNGYFVWFPIVSPSSEFSGESTWAGGLTALVGATVFEVGSVLLMLEAVNENRTDCFGWAVEEKLDGSLHLHPKAHCRHHHARKGNLVASSSTPQHDDLASGDPDWSARTWYWWPSWYELRTHYIREIGFLACSAQMFGATIFWISGFTALPPILNHFSTPATNCAYWLPQTIGGTGFIVSSTLFMIEVQPRWYIPTPSVLGWHVGFWNLIGALGFTLCGALGFGGTRPGIQYALTLSTFIGAWAFLIGSLFQWFESLDKYPIWIESEARKYDKLEGSL